MKYRQSDYIYSYVLTHPGLSSVDKVVLIFILIQAPAFHPTASRIAASVNKHERTVRKSLAKLISLKILRKLPITHVSGARGYELHPQAAVEIGQHARNVYGPRAYFNLERV